MTSYMNGAYRDLLVEERIGFDLEERTLEFAKRVIQLCKKLPSNTINYKLIGQLIDASGSVGANYREANEALSKRDFLHRIKIVRKEAKEAHFWLQLVGEANQEFSNEINDLIGEAIQLRKIFSAIVKKSEISRPAGDASSY